MAIPTFNPDNVLLHQVKEGEIPQKYSSLILQDVIQNSVVMQLGRYERMTDKVKEFQYFAEGPGAYWVGETEKIKTSKPKWLTVKMEAKKLGVILPVSREYLKYRMSDFFTFIRPKIAEAFYKKFDEAVILNAGTNPFGISIEQSATTRDIEGELTFDNILALEDKLLENDIEGNAFISKNQNATALRAATKVENGVTTQLFDRAAGTLDSYPLVNLKSAEMKKGDLFFGNFDYLYYGIPYNIHFKVSEEAQLSTITNADGSPVNLFEQEMMALRATMDIGVMIVKDEAFAKIKKASV